MEYILKPVLKRKLQSSQCVKIKHNTFKQQIGQRKRTGKLENILRQKKTQHTNIWAAAQAV